MAEIKKITFGEASEDAEAPAEQTSSSFLTGWGATRSWGRRRNPSTGRPSHAPLTTRRSKRSP